MLHTKNAKTNTTSDTVTQRAYKVKPDTNLGKSLKPGLQSGTYFPPPKFPHHKKTPPSQKKKATSKKRKP